MAHLQPQSFGHDGRPLEKIRLTAIRAFTHAAAQELRPSGIHVALLIVDGPIESPLRAVAFLPR